MKTLTFTFLSLFIVGCGPFQPKVTCHLNGTGEWFLQDNKVSCSYYQYILDQAIETTLKANFAPEAEYRKVISGSTVWVQEASWDFNCYFAKVEGCVSPDASEIQVDRAAGSIMHELLHRWDIAGLHHDPITSALHTGWEEKGWLKLSGHFIDLHPPSLVPSGSAGFSTVHNAVPVTNP